MAEDNTSRLTKANTKDRGHTARLRELKIPQNPNKLCV
jgi:hypothetical protein